MFQLHCCGVEGSDDFKMAKEFIKYTNEKGDGQNVPEACCRLDSKYDTALFKPADENCIYAPTTSNSYMNRVRSFFLFNVEIKRFRDSYHLFRQ